MAPPANIEVNNKLESMLSGVPGEIQSIVRPPLEKLMEPIEWVTGDPDDLTRAAEVWRDAANQVREVTSQEKEAVAKLRESWKGQDSDAFDKKLNEISSAMDGTAKNLDETSNVLVEAAKGCVEAVNLIFDLIVDFIMMAVTDLLVSLALSVVSFGATLAAGAAKIAISATSAFARIMKVVDKLTDLLRKLEKLLERLREGIAAYRKGFERLKDAKGATSAMSAEGLGVRVAKSAYTAPVRMPLGQAIGEPVPGGVVGGMYQVGKDATNYALSEDAQHNNTPDDQGK